MNFLKALLAAFTIFILGSASVALAGKQDFTLENQTGYQIQQVYVSSVNTDDWEEDVLGRDYLDDRQRLNISFPRGSRGCMYDLKVVYSDGDAPEWNNFNLCQLSVIRLYYDRRTGETTAEYE